MNCKHCNAYNYDDAIYCHKCGKKIKENNKILLFVPILLCCVVVAIIIICINNQSSYSSPTIDTDTIAADTMVEYTKATRLNVSSDKVYLNSDGDLETIVVETDGNWQIGTNATDWVGLAGYGDSLYISASINKGRERTDYFTIIAGDLEKRIDIIQSASSSPYGEITKIWVDYNVYNGGEEKGMMIHVAFNVNNMLGKEGMVCAYFYFSDGTALTDTNGRYETTDGNVAVGKDFAPSYENSIYNDFHLFMPYSELHLDSSADIFFKVSLWYNNEKISKDSEKEHMEYTKN